MLSPADVARKWQQKASTATDQMTKGVNAVTSAPGQKAAAQSAVWLANVQAAAEKWKRNVASVSLEDWRNAMITKGIPRQAQGVTQALPKMQAFLEQFLPYVQSVKNSIDSTMPRGNLEQNLNRMMENARRLAQFKRGIS